MEAISFSDMQLNPQETLQNQLYRHLVDKINSGRLPPGTRLPSSRRVSKELGISRNTVTEVIDQLKSEGFLQSQQGSSVFISMELPVKEQGLESVRWHKQNYLPTLSNFALNLTKESKYITKASLPFTPGIPDLRAFPIKTWLKIQRRHQNRVHLLGFDNDQGYAPLQNALAKYLKISRGVLCDPEQIIITHGAQQALALCSLLLLNEGDSILMENPGYRRAGGAFKSNRINIDVIPVDKNGIDIDQLPNETDARLIYCTPTHQYPLGGILSAAKRLKLLDWASKKNIWIIEDDYDSEFHFYGKPIAALQGMSNQPPVIYIGSFSKTLFPSLRLGYMVVPKLLVSPFVKAKSYQSGEIALLPQAIAADFIAEGHFVRHLRRMRVLYQEKWEHTENLVNYHLRNLATPVAESAGMHLALKANVSDDEALASQFYQAGFGSTALSSYYYSTEKNNNTIPEDSKGPENLKAPEKLKGLVLGFSNTTENERVTGILALKKLLLNA